MPRVIQGRGELRSLKEANIVAPLNGIVKELRRKVGDAVTEAEVLAIIESKELIQRIASSQESLAAARNQLVEKERQLVDAEKQLEKTRDLITQDLIARRELDQAQLATDTARAQLELAKAQVAQQQSMLAQAQKVLGLSRLTAPFKGVVTARMVEAGSEVRDSTPILTIGSLDVLKVAIIVPRGDLSFLREGMAVQVDLDRSPTEVHYGKVARLSSPPESPGDAFVEIHLSNKNHELRPGVRAAASISVDSGGDALVVPLSAVIETEESAYVFAVVNGEAQRREVLKGAQKDGKVVIQSGLGEGDWIVTSGQQQIKPGTSVRLPVRDDGVQTSPNWLSLLCSSILFEGGPVPLLAFGVGRKRIWVARTKLRSP